MKEPLTFHLATFTVLLNTFGGKILKSAGIEMSMDQLAIIMLIHFYGPRSQSQLLVSSCISESIIQRSLTRLVQQKYIRVDQQNVISLTHAGDAVSTAIEIKLLEIDQTLFGHLDERDHQRVILKAGLMCKKIVSIDDPFNKLHLFFGRSS